MLARFESTSGPERSERCRTTPTRFSSAAVSVPPAPTAAAAGGRVGRGWRARSRPRRRACPSAVRICWMRSRRAAARSNSRASAAASISASSSARNSSVMYWASSPRPTARVGLGVGGRLGLDARADALADRLRRDAVLVVVLPPASRRRRRRLVDRPLHRVGHLVGVEDHLGVDVAGRAADGLHQRRFAAQEALLVGVEDGHQRDLGQVEPFAQQVHAHQHVEMPLRAARAAARRARRRPARCAATCSGRPACRSRPPGPRPAAWSAW